MGAVRRAARPLDRRDERLNAWLTVLLLGGIVVVGNLVADARLALRKDLSQDQLFTVAPTTKRILRGLEDRLQVRTYFTRETELGDVQLGRARLEAQLAEFRALARGRMEVVDLDPVASTSARTEALRAGVRSIPETRSRGTETIDEDVWLGLTLRYRGREQVIPYAQPWRFEVQFASAVHALVRDRRVVVGLVGMPLAPPASGPPGTPAAAAEAEVARAWPTFGQIAAGLHRTREVREMTGLAEGSPVPHDVDVLVVVASEWMHPRAVFELDRYVQRGGALVVAVDDPVFNWSTGGARAATPRSPLETELGRMLRTLGADVRPQHVWDLDPAWQTTHGAYRTTGSRIPAVVTSPAVVTVRKEGLSQELPPTRDLQQVTFWWAHPIVDGRTFPPPPGVRREDLAWTSPRGRLAGALAALPSDPRTVAEIDRSVRADPGGSYVLAAAFSGALPTAYPNTVPPARDPFGSGPNATYERRAQPLPSGATPGTVVVVGDADWLRDSAVAREGVLMDFNQANGQLLLENLVDWLTLDADLIELRSRVPRERPLVDFVAEALAAAGLADVDPIVTEHERRARAAREDAALARARARRWWTILEPIGVALAVLALAGGGWNLYERRRAGGASR